MQESRDNSFITKKSDMETQSVLMVPSAYPEVVDLAPGRSGRSNAQGTPGKRQAHKTMLEDKAFHDSLNVCVPPNTKHTLAP